MLINTAPVNEAVLSNVGEVGEFKIRNSAKAFNILSSGLYANKIKAIIRELSCNAVDSHVAAGKKDTPFDVHLPNSLEPWFAIRDYGTGLNHDQVTNIYTTYFESTKTNSNDFIGALGLGSKSPFSYTDNFTVTAIKDGVKRIYTAFINDFGVPSIAKMGEEESTEPNGVEVKFSVEEYYDFRKFEQEAVSVYRYFALRPVITGQNITIRDIEYLDKDIVPGVHTMRDTRNSVAIMGNIAYPIDMPNSESNLGTLHHMLYCGLMLEFTIGELDFQASREGLSYIPQTIASIKDKLIALQTALTDVLATEANKIENLWERTAFLLAKKEQPLWASAVEKYVVDNKFPLINIKQGSWEHLRALSMTFYEDELASKYNIVIRGFSKHRNSQGVQNIKQDVERAKVAGQPNRTFWSISANMHTVFVKNNTKVGATERARYHWRHTRFADPVPYQTTVYVLDFADKAVPAKFDEFLKDLHNPPVSIFADTLLQRERATVASTGQTISILRLAETDGYRSRNSDGFVWKDGGKASDFDGKAKFYYLPLSGYQVESKFGLTDAKALASDLSECGIGSLSSLTIYGVRKADIEYIKLQKNWINLEDAIKDTLVNLSQASMASLAYNKIDRLRHLQYNASIVQHIVSKDNPYVTLVTKLKNITANSYDERALKNIINRYAKDTKISVEAIVEMFKTESNAVDERYPLLKSLDFYRVDTKSVAHYINLIDDATKE